MLDAARAADSEPAEEPRAGRRARRRARAPTRRGARPPAPRPHDPAVPTAARLLTLDQLIAELPPGKPPQTWKRWLYERTRRGEIPGCVKLGGMLFFEREPALAWLRAGTTATR